MKLKDAIVLGIGFYIGKVIVSTVTQCIDNIVTFGNNVIDVMNNEELSFEESVDKVMNNIKKKKTANRSKSIKELLDLLKKTQKSPKHGLFSFAQNIQLL